MFDPNEDPSGEAWDEMIPVLSPPPEVARGKDSCLVVIALTATLLGLATHAFAGSSEQTNSPESAAADLAVAASAPQPVAAAKGTTAASTGTTTETTATTPRALTAAESRELAEATYIYLSSTRKDGSLSTPAEIWFEVIDGAIYVGTRPDSWRAKRLGWGRDGARIWIGKRDGPSLRATGAFVEDPALYQRFCDGLAAKYPKSWPRFEKGFREGLPDGSRVLIRYTPVGSTTS